MTDLANREYLEPPSIIDSDNQEIIKIAEKYGGRPYSTGLYYANKNRLVLGSERVDRIRVFKTKVDPKGILNPGSGI